MRSSTNRHQTSVFFHVFGCKCLVLNDKDDLGKHGAKGEEAIFILYSKDSATFRVYIKKNGMVTESTNVNFAKLADMNLSYTRPGLKLSNAPDLIKTQHRIMMLVKLYLLHQMMTT